MVVNGVVILGSDRAPGGKGKGKGNGRLGSREEERTGAEKSRGAGQEIRNT